MSRRCGMVTDAIVVVRWSCREERKIHQTPIHLPSDPKVGPSESSPRCCACKSILKILDPVLAPLYIRSTLHRKTRCVLDIKSFK